MSEANVRPAREDDIPAVVDLLHTRMNGKIEPQRWRRILDYPWRPPEAERGWLVEDRGRIVGFMGTIYSDRVVAGRTHRFCDLSSWYLMRDYRGDGTGDRLLRACMAKPDVTYQTMTARRATGRKIRALGFSVLDDTRRVFRPSAPSSRERSGLEIVGHPAAIRARLDPDQRRAHDLHAGFGLGEAYIPDFGLWLVWQRKLKGEGIAYHEVLHASNPARLSANAQAICDAIVSGDTGILAIDSRWMREGDPAGTIETIALPRWFRSPNLEGVAVDHLYSEVILLDRKLP